jgi:hypothetical protein
LSGHTAEKRDIPKRGVSQRLARFVFMPFAHTHIR